MDADKVIVHFSTTVAIKSRVKKLAKTTGHSASFLAGNDIKDEHLSNMLGK